MPCRGDLVNKRTEELYSYDPNSNDTSVDGVGATLSADNELSARTSAAYARDPAGDLTKVENPDGWHTLYAYNNRNRLNERHHLQLCRRRKLASHLHLRRFQQPDRSIGFPSGPNHGESVLRLRQSGRQSGQMVLAFGSTGSSPTTAQLTDRFLWGPAVDQILADNRVLSGIWDQGFRLVNRCERFWRRTSGSECAKSAASAQPTLVGL